MLPTDGNFDDGPIDTLPDVVQCQGCGECGPAADAIDTGIEGVTEWYCPGCYYHPDPLGGPVLD